MKLEELYEIIKQRKDDMPEGSYVASLFREGEDRIIQKVGEEAVEVVIAAKNSDRQKLIEESSDLFFMFLILLNQKGIALEDIGRELEKRRQKRISDTS